MPGPTMRMPVFGSSCAWDVDFQPGGWHHFPTRRSLHRRGSSPDGNSRRQENIVDRRALFGAATVISNAAPGNSSRKCWRGLGGDTRECFDIVDRRGHTLSPHTPQDRLTRVSGTARHYERMPGTYGSCSICIRKSTSGGLNGTCCKSIVPECCPT